MTRQYRYVSINNIQVAGKKDVFNCERLCVYIQGCLAGGRVKAAVEANPRKKRKITAKGSLPCRGPLTNIPINPGRLEKLIY